MKSITFLMPPFSYSPVGGFKVVLQYANLLSEDGYDIHIVYADSTKYKNIKWRIKYKLLLKHILFQLNIIKRSIRIWFPLDNRVKEHNVYSLDYNLVPKTDIYICTGVDTAPFLNRYPIPDRRKYYFIQDYEIWGRTDKQVRETYHYSMNKIVISDWLRDILEKEEHIKCFLVPNGFNLKEFYLTIPIEYKNKYKLSLLYHEAVRKDIKTALKAIDIVKKRFPQVQVDVFGTPIRPNFLPEWYHYYQCPSKEQHLKINNESAIYVASSIEEGWGLTIGEAMLCGQAVACTDNRGYKEMAKDKKTALLSPTKNPDALAKNIIYLINNDVVRKRIASQGLNYIKSFSEENSYRLFKSALNLI